MSGSINPRFLPTRNLSDILLGNAYIAVAAVGMSMVIISGNIDISVGALIGVLATISGSLAVAGAPTLVTWLAPLVIGVVVMALQGAVIAYLADSRDRRDAGHAVDPEGRSHQRHRRADGSLTCRKASISPISSCSACCRCRCVIMVVATMLAALWMRHSPSGRAIYATGGNPEAARLCGCRPQRTVVMVFALHGFFTGLAALVYATQLRVIQSTTPPRLELTIITAAVVGGVSILGGVGSVVGSTFAAILIAEIASALVFINISPYWIRRRAGRADSRHRDRRHPAPPAPCGAGVEAMSVAPPKPALRVPRWLNRHETLLAASSSSRSSASASSTTAFSPSTICSTRAG